MIYTAVGYARDVIASRGVGQMHRLFLAGIGVALLVTSGPAEAGLGEAAAVEHARMNALAGGPTNEYDAWMLERYGCYSGTPSPPVTIGRTITARDDPHIGRGKFSLRTPLRN